MSTRLATGAQVKQFLGVCERVSGELSSQTGGLSNTGAPPVRMGFPRAGPPPRAGGAHPSTGGLDRTEGGGRLDLPFCTCLSVKLVSSHPLPPGPQASGLGVTHTTCFLGPQPAAAARGTPQPPSSQEPSPHSKPPWGRTCPSSVSPESPYHRCIETDTGVVSMM